MALILQGGQDSSPGSLTNCLMPLQPNNTTDKLKSQGLQGGKAPWRRKGWSGTFRGEGRWTHRGKGAGWSAVGVHAEGSGSLVDPLGLTCWARVSHGMPLWGPGRLLQSGQPWGAGVQAESHVCCLSIYEL